MSSDNTVLGMRDGRYFAMVLFCYGTEDRDWLASVWRDGEEGPWHFDYRFRYYATREKGDAFDGQDEKSSYSVDLRPNMTEEEACALARLMGEVLVAKGFNETLDVIEPKSAEALKVYESLRGRPWFYSRLESGAEA